MYHGLNDVAPYAHTNVHAKYWNRWKEPDVQRNVRIMIIRIYTGKFALEYEEGPWDGVEGAKYLPRSVSGALVLAAPQLDASPDALSAPEMLKLAALPSQQAQARSALQFAPDPARVPVAESRSAM